MGKSEAKLILYIGSFLGMMLMWAAMMVGIILTVPDYCGSSSIDAKGQVVCNHTPDDGYTYGKVVVYGDESNLASYIFTKKPKSKETTDVFNYTFSNKMFSSINVPTAVSAKISYILKVNTPVDIEFVGKENRNTEVIHTKTNVKDTEGSFTITRNLYNPHFIISGLDYFSGTFSVSITWKRLDISSVSYAQKCTNYPCEFDFEDIRFAGKTLWLITDNTGTQSHTIDTEMGKDPLVWIIVAVVLGVVGLLCMVGSIVLVLIFI